MLLFKLLIKTILIINIIKLSHKVLINKQKNTQKNIK